MEDREGERGMVWVWVVWAVGKGVETQVGGGGCGCVDVGDGDKTTDGNARMVHAVCGAARISCLRCSKGLIAITAQS